MKIELITKEGMSKLLLKLKLFKTVLDEYQKKLRISISYGDLKENSDYTTMNRNLELKLKEYNKLLEFYSYTKLWERTNDDIIDLNSWVFIIIGNKETLKFQLVSKIETDIDKGMIYYDSPLGKKLFGKCVGGKILINNRKWTIQKIIN